MVRFCCSLFQQGDCPVVSNSCKWAQTLQSASLSSPGFEDFLHYMGRNRLLLYTGDDFSSKGYGPRHYWPPVSCPPQGPARKSQTWRGRSESSLPGPSTMDMELQNTGAMLSTQKPGSRPPGMFSTLHSMQAPDPGLRAPTVPGTFSLHTCFCQSSKKGCKTTTNRARKACKAFNVGVLWGKVEEEDPWLLLCKGSTDGPICQRLPGAVQVLSQTILVERWTVASLKVCCLWTRNKASCSSPAEVQGGVWHPVLLNSLLPTSLSQHPNSPGPIEAIWGKRAASTIGQQTAFSQAFKTQVGQRMRTLASSAVWIMSFHNQSCSHSSGHCRSSLLEAMKSGPFQLWSFLSDVQSDPKHIFVEVCPHLLTLRAKPSQGTLTWEQHCWIYFCVNMLRMALRDFWI